MPADDIDFHSVLVHFSGKLKFQSQTKKRFMLLLLCCATITNYWY